MLTLLSRSDLPPFVVVMGGAAVLVVLLLKFHQERQRLVRHCRQLATRLGGRVESGGLFGGARLLFTLRDRPAVLEFQDGKHPQTHLRVALLRDPGGSLRISRDSLAEVFITVLKGRRLRVGDRLFDDTYAVRSYPRSLGERIFTPGRRQEAMTAVRRLIGCSGLFIQVTPTLLEVRIRELADAPEVALALVRTGEDFLCFLVEAEPEPGIKWGSVLENPSGRCPICCTTLNELLIRCPRCLSPHHGECWDYLGRCATYGCSPGSRRRSA